MKVSVVSILIHRGKKTCELYIFVQNEVKKKKMEKSGTIGSRSSPVSQVCALLPGAKSGRRTTPIVNPKLKNGRQ